MDTDNMAGLGKTIFKKMKLLMITRKVDRNDASPAGFTYNWVKKFGEKLEKLYVITWQKSDRGDLPENIEIISLPDNKFFKIFDLQFKLLRILPKVDGVFCHQNPEYTIITGLLARIFGKKIVSWYAHKAVNWRRRLMELFADTITTPSDKSFRNPLFPKKVLITGHGIDTGKFMSPNDAQNQKFTILSVGRISPAKNYETLIKAVEILVKQKRESNLEVQIIGGPVLKKDKEYFTTIREMVKNKNLGEYIEFLGPVSHNEILPNYQNCDLFVNLSQTGSVDKAVLEAMSCEKIVLTSNEAFEDILKDNRLMFKQKDLYDLANKIIDLIKLSKKERQKIGQNLRKKVVENHNLNKLVDKILRTYEE